MKLSTKQIEITLPKVYPHFRMIQEAIDETFVCLYWRSPEASGILHMKASGEIIKEYEFDWCQGCFQMTNEWQIIFLNNMKHEIITIDLRSGLMKTFKHILVSQWFTSWLDVFRETKYFCVCELGRRENEEMLRLSYFRDSEERPFHVYVSTLDEWHNEDHTCKINEHSMYCWYNPKDLLHLRVFIYELVNNNRGNLRVVSLDERVWGPLSTKFPELEIRNVWEIRRYSLCFIFHIEMVNFWIPENSLLMGTRNVCCVVNIVDMTSRLVFFPLRNGFFLETKDVRTYSLFRRQRKENMLCITEEIYVDNATESIIAQRTFEKHHNVELHSSLCNPFNELMINKNRQGFIITITTLMTNEEYLVVNEPALACLWMLCELYEDFDEDLLKETVEIFGK